MMHLRAVFYILIGLLAATAAISQVRLQAIQGEELEGFLREAKIVEAKGIPQGITLPSKLTLEWKGLTHYAAFKRIDDFKGLMKFDGGGVEMNFQDSWKFEIAAYEVDKIIGLGMVPTTLERTYRGETGSVQFWIEDAMTEGERLQKKLQPPSPAKWNDLLFKERVFDALIYNIDRNLGNRLITKDWEIVLIDHSRSFRTLDALRQTKDLTRFSRSLLAGLERLNVASLKEKTGKYLTKEQINGLLKRRDRILELARKLEAEKAAVIYP
jgi:hypothetical protein